MIRGGNDCSERTRADALIIVRSVARLMEGVEYLTRCASGLVPGVSELEETLAGICIPLKIVASRKVAIDRITLSLTLVEASIEH